jgi:hypothetical protein
MTMGTREGLVPAIALTILPFIFLWVLVKLLPPWQEKTHDALAADESKTLVSL